jgi:hypothetical protein
VDELIAVPAGFLKDAYMDCKKFVDENLAELIEIIDMNPAFYVNGASDLGHGFFVARNILHANSFVGKYPHAEHLIFAAQDMGQCKPLSDYEAPSLTETSEIPSHV